MDQATWPTVEDLRSHWQWRPEWEEERACLLWYLTFEDQPRVREHAGHLQLAMRGSRTIDVVPQEWLHLTLDDVAYADEVSPDQVERLARSTQDAVVDFDLPPLDLGPAVAMPEALVLQATPRRPLTELRDRLCALSAAALGRGKEPLNEEFRPHVTLAYVNDDCPVRSVMDPLADLAPDTVRVTVPRLTLASVTRRDRHYQWRSRAVLALAGRRREDTDRDAR
jgi:2'-5' RNA ligase